MTGSKTTSQALRYAVAGTLAVALLSGCGGGGKIASASSGSVASQKSGARGALAQAEGAVAASPRVAALRVGPGATPGVEQGPLINARALDKVERHIADARAQGAHIVVGGGRHALGGTFFEPTVLANVAPDALVAHEETFGPLAPVFRFKDEKDVIALANNSPFGLASYFYARDLGRVWRVAEALESGMVGVNTGLITTEVAPFGGVKESGLGREGSKHGMEEYVEIKYVMMAGI